MSGRRAIGLDIGTSGVRAAQLVIGKRGVTLERFGQVALPPGAVRHGEVVDPQAVATALRQLWSSGRFSTKKVIGGVANGRVIVRQVDLPWIPIDELRKALPFQVQDVIPMPVDEAILDVHPVEEVAGENGERLIRVLLVAAGRDMVSAAMQAITLAGLSPTMIDLTSFAVLRSLASPDVLGTTSSAEAVVDIGASVTNIVVHQAGVPRFVRILMTGGADITEAVAERLGVPIEQAEQIKQAEGLPRTDEQAMHPGAGTLEVGVATWIDEVRGSLDYYVAQPGAVRVSRVVLSGGGSFLRGLAERLAPVVRADVEYGSVLSRMAIGRTGLTAEQLAYIDPLAAVPVGLALGAAA